MGLIVKVSKRRGLHCEQQNTIHVWPENPYSWSAALMILKNVLGQIVCTLNYLKCYPLIARKVEAHSVTIWFMCRLYISAITFFFFKLCIAFDKLNGSGWMEDNISTYSLKYLFLPLHQSRTPALVFEHVNNTDFKVGVRGFSRSGQPPMWKPPFLAYPLFPRTRVCMWWRNMKSPVLCLRCQKVSHFLVLSSFTGTFPPSVQRRLYPINDC